MEFKSDDNSQEDYCSLVKKLINSCYLTSQNTSLIIYDLTTINRQLKKITEAFPTNALHAIALKANPLVKILEITSKLGFGAEAASLPEVEIALKAGFQPQKIVFDSPAKTHLEIKYALENGININANSFEEVDRIKNLIEFKNNQFLGLRINPEIGKGKIHSTSVATVKSKFGVSITKFRKKIFEVYESHEWLNAIHMHIGSQGMSVNLFYKAITILDELINEINSKRKKKGIPHLQYIDIGGGYPIDYKRKGDLESFETFVSILRQKAPNLFTQKFRLVTEYGRFVYANSGWAISRIEYVTKVNDTLIVICHLGADLLLRKAYNPNDWHHEIIFFDKNGNIKKGKQQKGNIYGPLCFSGDCIAKNLELPKLGTGDFLAILDIGAYTLSMWSRYNSRQIPQVLLCNGNKDFEIIKEKESIDSVINFWK